jgi:hypothetical protein
LIDSLFLLLFEHKGQHFDHKKPHSVCLSVGTAFSQTVQPIDQRILDTNAGKQQSYAATDV